MLQGDDYVSVTTDYNQMISTDDSNGKFYDRIPCIPLLFCT